MKGIISADKTPVRRPNTRPDLRCRKTVAKVLSLISEIFGTGWGIQVNGRIMYVRRQRTAHFRTVKGTAGMYNTEESFCPSCTASTACMRSQCP